MGFKVFNKQTGTYESVTIPALKGDKGDKGDKGATGATGATGPQGPQGDKGDPGSIDDTLVVTNQGWSSQKISDEITTAMESARGSVGFRYID